MSLLKKLFEPPNQLILKAFKQLRFDGSYRIEQIALQSYACCNQEFRILIEAQQIDIHYLYDAGFLLECQHLKKFSVERLA